MSWSASIPGIILLALLVYFHQKHNRGPFYGHYWWAWGIRILAGLFIGWIYLFHYESGDTLAYMQDARVLRDMALNSPSDYLTFLWNSHLPDQIAGRMYYDISSPRALFFDKITSLLSLFCGDQYWLISAWYSTLSFIGFYCLANAVHRKFGLARDYLGIALFFMPSVVLWTVGVTKESLAVGSLAGMIGLVLNMSGGSIRNVRWTRLIALIILFWITWKLKYYYAALAAPALIAPLITEWLKLGKWGVLVWLGTWLIAVAMAGLIQVNLDPLHLPEVIKANHDAFISKSEPGDIIEYRNMEADWLSVLLNFPKALWSGLFRPLPWDVNNALKILPAIESTMLLLLFIWQLKKFSLLRHSPYLTWILSAMTYIILLATFLALSTPNFGTLVRYKAGFYFIMVCIILWEHPIFAWLKKKING